MGCCHKKFAALATVLPVRKAVEVPSPAGQRIRTNSVDSRSSSQSNHRGEDAPQTLSIIEIDLIEIIRFLQKTNGASLPRLVC